MDLTRLVGALCLLASLTACQKVEPEEPAGGAAQEPTQGVPSPRNDRPVRHVTETLTWELDGERRPATVDLQNWIIGGGQSIEALPLPGPGVQIVRLAAGELTTVIAGERVERFEGEYWSVPAGETMGVETEDDSAILLTVSVRTP